MNTQYIETRQPPWSLEMLHCSFPKDGHLFNLRPGRWEGVARERAQQAKETLYTKEEHKSLKSKNSKCVLHGDETKIQNRKKPVYFFKFWIYRIKLMIIQGSGQDGGIVINASFPRTTKRRITTNLKTINNQKYQEIKLHGTLTTKG